MWSRLILLMRAKRALRAGRLESALAVLEDPVLRNERRARDLREELLGSLEQRCLQRQEQGRLRLALADARRLHELDPERLGAAERIEEMEAALRAASEESARLEQQRESFERALAEGRLNEARDLLQSPSSEFSGEERQALELRLAERRKGASQALVRARKAVSSGLPSQAREAFGEARRLCSDSLSFRERLLGLSANWARERFHEVRAALAEGRAFDAAQALANWIQSEPESEDLVEAQDLLLSVGEQLAAQIRETAREGDFAAAHSLACQVPTPFGKIAALRQLRERVERAQVLVGEAERDPRRRVEALRRLQRETGWEALGAVLRQSEAEAGEIDRSLQEARDLLEKGEVEAGRAKVDAVLDRWAGCEEARALLDGLLEDERDRQQRLESAREDLRVGRLRQAEKQLLRLVSGGRAADAARALLRDISRLQKKMARELSSVRARLESGASPESLLASLERLERIQSDSPELEELRNIALRRRSQGERVGQFREALAARRSQPLIAALRSCFEQGHFDADDREDRRVFLDLGRELEKALREELQSGDVLFVYDVLRGLEVFVSKLGLEAGPLLASAEERIDAARREAELGLAALDARQASKAQQCLEDARAACANEPSVLRLAHKMRRLQGTQEDLREALRLAESDRAGACERLAGVGPTPRPLMSLAFDVKDKLARSGDFERGCRLEVEEAGEYLLFTEDRLRIGNASSTSYPQIPVLARIRPQHAVLERRVSFHGGVNYEVQSEEGSDTRLRGRLIEKAPLQHGDQVLLGGVLPISFRRPSRRSVSVLLRLEKGFESRGVTRMLWVKQGGRDGKVLIGRGKDCHVRVRAAEPELFLWAPGPGRLSVHFAGLGDCDGASFTGEMELRPGAVVRCGEIVFRVLPL
ncbi:MAG: hypothetical protein CSA62_06285 [Planctomycetota bacterium]|nr:MAG: hypothetical protein CSA62_06285 [Planctomycetota bacterium]